MKIESLVSDGFEALGPRFNLIGLLPGTVLCLFFLALYWSGAPAQTPDLQRVVRCVATLEAKESIILVVAVLVFGLLLQPLQLSMVRFLEGYWGHSWLAGKVTMLGVSLQRRGRAKLAGATQCNAPADDSSEKACMALAAWRLRLWYPPEEKLLPTRLGNVLRSAEDRAGRRYGLDAVVIWPRLYPLIGAKLAGVLADQRDQLDLAVRFCVVFFLAAAAAAAALYRHPAWLVVPAIALVLAWLSYRSAIAAAVAYGETIETAFDLHRFDLLKALRLPLPINRESERAANQQLSDFLRQGIPVNFAYQHPGDNGHEVGKEGGCETD